MKIQIICHLCPLGKRFTSGRKRNPTCWRFWRRLLLRHGLRDRLRVHGPGELEGLAQNALGAEDLSGLCHPIDGRAASMEVDSDALCRRASSYFEVSFCKSELARISQGAEAHPFIASDMWGAKPR